MDKIAVAAIRQGAVVFSMERPARHHDIIREMAEAGMPTPIQGEQGFVTSDGRFVGREEARRIAEVADQLIECAGEDGVPFKRQHSKLFSEDVW